MVLLWERLAGRNAHDTGRQLLEKLYQQETGQALPEIRLAKQGKPYFADSLWHFSISHTKNHVFCALSRDNIGIDAEETDRNIDLRLSEKILSPGEKVRYDAAEDKRATLLRLWVLKEAWVKYTGEGLRGYPNHTDFSPDDPRLQISYGCLLAIIEKGE